MIAAFRLLFLGDFDVFPSIMNSTFETAKTAFEISIGLTGVLSLWMGVMKIGERGGVIQFVARLLGPLFKRLFPEVPEGHPVVGNIFMNISANMLGLDMPPRRSDSRRWKDCKNSIRKKIAQATR